MSSPVTLVTAFLALHEDRGSDKSPDRCWDLFRQLVATGLPIVLYTSPEYASQASALPPSVHVRILELKDTLTAQCVASHLPLSVPTTNAPHHDTLAFMTLMNAKTELVGRVAKENPFNSTHIGWIDFSICHVFHAAEPTLGRLRTYCSSALRSPMLAMPGCWPAGAHSYAHAVAWRFCGGFFLGDLASVQSFCTLHADKFPLWLKATKTLVWEVNIWAWMEATTAWRPDWFAADHNDTIVAVPSHHLSVVASLTTIPPRISTCRLAIDSLLTQVDHVYMCVSNHYERFGDFHPPDYLLGEPYASKVTVVVGSDHGPATKYLGALTQIPQHQWVLFCDDDQEYHPTLVARMAEAVVDHSVYQNRYEIVRHGSGGTIHGYVGNLMYRGVLNALPSHPLPPCARFVDDQWMSVYCFLHGIPIRPTGVIHYNEIFGVLNNGYEKVGEAPLAALGTRDHCVRQLAEYFNITFQPGGLLTLTSRATNSKCSKVP